MRLQAVACVATLRRIKFKYGNMGVRYKRTNNIKRNRNNIEMAKVLGSPYAAKNISMFKYNVDAIKRYNLVT